MNTSNFLDANVWLALIWERHQHSEMARSWFESSPEASFLFCRFTQITVLRLLTTGTVMGNNVLTMKRAWDIWDDVAADDRVRFVPEPEEIDCGFASIPGHERVPKSLGPTRILSASRKPPD